MFQCNVKTKISTTKYDFKWTIENLSEILNEEIFINFKMNNECWYMGLKSEYASDLKITLYRSVSNSQIRIESDLSITDCNGRSIYNESKRFLCKKHCDKNRSNCVAYIHGRTFLKIKDESNDEIIITINLKVFSAYTKDIESLPEENELQMEVQKAFSTDILNMLDNNSETDIILLVDGEKIGAHKAILCARSPVFAKMFHLKMTETENNIVQIEDISVSAMKEVISFMYSRVKLDYDLDTAMDVYYAADKYEVVKLRELCGKIILIKLNSDNAGQLLQMADRHNDVFLKTKMMRFIKDNFETCVKAYWWGVFKHKKNSEIFNELISFISE